jgi:hypothetical protein
MTAVTATGSPFFVAGRKRQRLAVVSASRSRPSWGSIDRMTRAFWTRPFGEINTCTLQHRHGHPDYLSTLSKTQMFPVDSCRLTTSR